MKKPLQKSGVLGLATNINQKTNPFMPGYGLYKMDGWRLPEESAITKFGGISKVNSSPLDESSYGGSGVFTGLFNYIPQNPYAFAGFTLPVSAIWTEVVWNGTVYTAIASDTRTTLTSPDGTAWTSHANALPSTGYVAMVWTGTFYCAISNANKSSTSTDGITWTAEGTLPTPSAGLWGDLAWNGTVLAAICIGPASPTIAQAATSSDGTAWTSRTLATSDRWMAIASNGSIFVAIAGDSSGGTNSVNTSPDGITWTFHANATLAFWKDIVWTGTAFVCIASDTALYSSTSTDGITWTLGFPVRTGQKLVWNGKYVVSFAPLSALAQLSINGISWGLVNTAFTTTSFVGGLATDGTSVVFLNGNSNQGELASFSTINQLVAATTKSIYAWTGTTFSELTTKMHSLPPVGDFYSSETLNDVMYLANGSNFNHKYYGGLLHNQGILPPSTPLTSAASGTFLTGVYSYKVTFINQMLGHESNPSPKSADITLANQGVSITNLPVSSDPQVTARNIYRTTAGGGVWLFLKTIQDNTTTSTTDSASDATLSIAVDNTGNGVPPLWSMIAMLNGFAFMVPKNSSRVWFSKVNFPNAVDSNDFRDLAVNDGTVITGLRLFRKQIIAFKSTSIWNGFGTDRYTFGFDPQVSKIGAVNNACIVEVPGKDVLAFIDGAKRFYFYDGATVTPAAEGITPILRNISTSDLASVVGTIHKATNQCRWVVKLSGSSQSDLMIWYDYVQNKWGTRTLTNTKTSFISSLLDSSRQEQCYIGGYTGTIWQMDTGTTDDGHAMTATVMDRGHPGPDQNGQQIDIENQKFFQVIYVFFKPQTGVAFTVYAVMDDPDGTPVQIGVIDGSRASGQDTFTFNKVGRRCYIQITEASSSYTPTLRGWLVGYKTVGRSNAP
jgi:hypothetical protein